MHEKNHTISWDAYEFTQHQKSAAWHTAYWLLFVALIGYAIYSQSIITMILFALMGIVGWFFATKQPSTVHYSLTPNGMVMGQKLLPFKNIKTFWILYDPPLVKTLNFETTAYLNQLVTIELGDQDPVAVKNFLQKFLMEDLDREESLTEIITRKAKF